MNCKAYKGILCERGNTVLRKDAYEFVRARGYFGAPEVLIPWFFSGNWIEDDEYVVGDDAPPVNVTLRPLL
ncbi:MAG: hypothetical protein RSC43_04110 [Clostridia bacterium]